MKNTVSKKAAYVGAGAGAVMFVLFGFLPGSLLGGAAGINIAGWLFGLPLESGIVSRSIVLASMLLGVMVSGVFIVMAASAASWLMGTAIESLHEKAVSEKMTELRRQGKTLLP